MRASDPTSLKVVRALKRGMAPVDVCTRYGLSWQAVQRIAGEVAKTQTGPAGPAPAVEPAIEPPIASAPAVVDVAIAFLRSKGFQVIAFRDGTFLLNDRDATATDLIARADRIRARLAGARS